MSRIDKAIEMAATIKSTARVLSKSEPAIGAPTVSSGLGAVAPLEVKNPALVAINQPNGIIAEEYNKLRTSILQLANSEPKKNVFLITSAVPGEGKTLTAVNLSLSLARTTDRAVVLVDADFRRPCLHKMLNIETEVGLAQCLQDHVPVEKALFPTGLGGLVVLTSGQQIKDPLELISSTRMQKVIQMIQGLYPDCYIIFDSPPVLPFADARVMGAFMDGTIFVIRENYSRLNQVKEGLESLNGCHVLGILCNDASVATDHKYDYYYQ